MLFRLVPESCTEASPGCIAQGFAHTGDAHLWCCNGVWGAYSNGVWGVCTTSALCPLLKGKPVVPHHISRRFHLVVFSSRYSQGLRFSKK